MRGGGVSCLSPAGSGCVEGSHSQHQYLSLSVVMTGQTQGQQPGQRHQLSNSLNRNQTLKFNIPSLFPHL